MRALPIATLLLIASIPFSQTANITSGIFSLCSFISGLLPVISIVLVVAAGAVYAGGQLMGAETRARANVWATGMLMGAVFGILIFVISPVVLGAMYGPSWDSSCQAAGGGGPARGDACPNYEGGYCPQGEVCYADRFCCPQADFCPEIPGCCQNGRVCCPRFHICISPELYEQYCT